MNGIFELAIEDMHKSIGEIHEYTITELIQKIKEGNNELELLCKNINDELNDS